MKYMESNKEIKECISNTNTAPDSTPAVRNRPGGDRCFPSVPWTTSAAMIKTLKI